MSVVKKLKRKSWARRERLAAVVGLLVLLGVAHLWWWYLPRARSGAPASGEPAERLLLGGEFDTAVWIPFPHQNLGAVAGVDDPRESLAAASRLYRRDPLVLPRFGPFQLPPARELTAAWDAGGRRFTVVARVYPSFAVIGRLAGKIAGNPWLAGGEVEGPYGTVDIAWDGLSWTATSHRLGPKAQPATETLAEPPRGSVEPALAWLRLASPAGVVPAGLYRLAAEDGAVSVVRWPSLSTPSHPLPPILEPSLFEANLFAGSLLDGDGASSPPSLALLGLASGDRGRQALALFSGPGFALIDDSAGDDLPLAGMGLALLLGDDGYRGSAGEWSLMAGGEENYRRSLELLPQVGSAFERWESGGEQRLVAAVVLDPAATLEALSAFAEELSARSVGELDYARRVADLELLLKPLGGFRRGSVVILRRPRRLALRLDTGALEPEESAE